MPVAFPEVTLVPEKHIFSWSEIARFFDFRVMLVFGMEWLSPVRELSLHINEEQEIILMSAGIMSPVFSFTMSPGTRL